MRYHLGPWGGKRVQQQASGEIAGMAPRLWNRLTGSPGAMALALVVLALLTTLPGVVRLPAVDRTEVVFADTTRDMVARSDWRDPRYRGRVHQYRPIGTYWAQGAVATIARALGIDADGRNITVYRLAGMVAVVASVLALFWLAVPLVGTTAAGIAAALFAVTPLTVLVAQLAIAEGLSLLPATIAMMALLRLYVNSDEARPKWLALLFWGAVGVGMVINALLVPLLVLSTLVALWLIDRDARWHRRVWSWPGVVLMLALASPWLIVRFHQDGVPFADMGWRDFIEAMTGSQDMKLRAWPGTFLLAAFVGFLPGTAMLPPAMLRLWNHRQVEPLARFLFAWIVGYLVFNELFSSEPGTYTVQVMFPAMALAVALLVVNPIATPESHAPPYHLAPWPPLATLFAVVLFAALYVFTGTSPTMLAIIGIVATAALFWISAAAGRHGALVRWAMTGVAALSLFAVTLLALVLPAISNLWPAERIADAIAKCPPATITINGFREPSAGFVTSAKEASPQSIATTLGEKTPRLTILEKRAEAKVRAAISEAGGIALSQPSACVTVYNVMRGCPLSFRIYETGAGRRCAFREDFDCNAQPPPPSFSSKDCD